MTTNETCPHCGAEKNVLGNFYKCLTSIDVSLPRNENCFERQLAQQAAEIERLRKALSLIYIYAKDDANSEYCSDTAFDALKEVK